VDGDLVEETLVRGIHARLKELEPVVAEYARLQAADGAGAGSGEQRQTAAGTRGRQHRGAGRSGRVGVVALWFAG
jgi:hypothetical protein